MVEQSHCTDALRYGLGHHPPQPLLPVGPLPPDAMEMQVDLHHGHYTARAGKPTGLPCRMRASGSKDPRCMFRTHWCIMSVFGCDPGRDCPRESSGMSGRFSHVPTDCGERTRPGRPVPLHPGRDEKHGRGTGNPTGLSRGRMSNNGGERNIRTGCESKRVCLWLL